MPRSGHSRSDYLFHDSDFFTVQHNNQERLKKAIDDAPPTTIRDGATNEVAERFVADSQLEVPELTEGAISVDIEEADVDVTGNLQYGHYGRGPHYAPGIRASYYVPFTGDSRMLKVKPSTFTTVLPAAAIEKNELRFTFELPGQPVAETKQAFDNELRQVKEYLGWLRENVKTHNESLLPLARQRIEARRSRLAEMERGSSSLGIPIRSARAGSGTPSLSSSSPSLPRPARIATTSMPSRHYDVALSFAGEDRPYVEQVATGLKTAGVEVFYDDFEKATLWGKNLVEHLAEIYQKNSRYVVMFISEHYVRKAWPKHERQHAQARALVAKEEYILPARFDDTEVPGMTNTVGHVDLRRMSPSELIDLILTKLGKKP
jgi:TIR domain